MDFEDLLGPLVGILCVVGITMAVSAAREEQAKWDAFQVEHKCKIVEKVKGEVTVGTGVGIGVDGNVGIITTTATTPDKTAWLCDDGVTYWR